MDVVKFSGSPCEYFRSRARFDEMVGTQKISETQKMSRLLQFLGSQARSAVAGFEGVPGGLSRALKMLQQRFGQLHIVAKACVAFDNLVTGTCLLFSFLAGWCCDYHDFESVSNQR